MGRVLLTRINKLEKTVEIAIVGKYVALHDAYLSIVESLSHAGFDANADVKIRWVNAEDITDENVGERLAWYSRYSCSRRIRRSRY